MLGPVNFIPRDAKCGAEGDDPRTKKNSKKKRQGLHEHDLAKHHKQ